MPSGKVNRFDVQAKKIVIAALFAALCCVATLIIQIPVSVTGGYINLGDSIVLVSAWTLGPVYGTVAAAVGSALADLLTGYAIYAPATFVIKGLMALCAYGVFSALDKGRGKSLILATAVSALVGELIMVSGYFAFSALILGNGLAALSTIYGDLIQASGGLIGSNLIFFLLSKNPFFKKLVYGK